jgi:hypothetical protein
VRYGSHPGATWKRWFNLVAGRNAVNVELWHLYNLLMALDFEPRNICDRGVYTRVDPPDESHFLLVMCEP